MCTNKDIQELLPAYREQALDHDKRSRVELHLSSCGECRAEVELLRVLAAEPVPDPGDAFWAAMPGRVKRAMHAEEERKASWWRSSVPLSLVLPRWAWAATAVLVVAAVSWLLVRPVPVRTARVTAPSRGTYQNTLTATDVLELEDLSENEVDAVDLWATEELALLQDDIIDTSRNGADLTLDDRLTELNAEELESLSRMLDSQNEEG
jgi:anti-sigma factor RsiW